MKNVMEIMEKYDIPGRDPGDLVNSPLTFADGAHYRIEIAGVERPSTFEAMLRAMEEFQVPVHRAICTVGGATCLTFSELQEMARLGASNRIELIMTPAPTRSWDTGRQLATPEGYVSGLRTRGSDNLRYVLSDIYRCIEAGLRGFLVVDEGLLWLLCEMREAGDLPRDVVFKVSVFAGHGNAAGAKLLEKIGADTFNPLADLTLPMLASIRKAVKMPLDLYIVLVDAMGGYNRSWEAAEMARVASPCYFKIEPGASEASIYKPYVTEAFHKGLVREKVKIARILTELIEMFNPAARCSEMGPKDLALPEV
ncbi:MAG: hypothetical protein HN366_08670 [Deltaproteobacteria bacterium]|nr:hypothetical protein [Deltaproteobacteria bacterium]